MTGITGPSGVTVPCRERVNLDPRKGSGEFTRSSLFNLLEQRRLREFKGDHRNTIAAQISRRFARA